MSDSRAEEAVLESLQVGEAQEFGVGQRLPNVVFSASVRKAVMNAIVAVFPQAE